MFSLRVSLSCAALAVLPLMGMAQQAPIATSISAIQGEGATSPMLDQAVVVKGLVSADLRVAFGGVLLLSAPGDRDANPATSEGLLVVIPRDVAVEVGDFVTVSGTVKELRGMTALDQVTDFDVATRTKVEPVAMQLPLPEGTTWESAEAMLVSFPEQLVVTELHNYGRYANVMLSQGERLMQPTSFMLPGAEAHQLAQQQRERFMVLLDDGRTTQNPKPLPFTLNGAPIRNGMSVQNLTGVLFFYGESFQFLPTAPVEWVDTNPRSATPPSVGGNLTAASFNVLNFFNGNGDGTGFPTSRGADTAEEYERQKAKCLATLTALNTDIIGLLEIENDGYDEKSSLAELTRSINDLTKGIHPPYEFVKTEAEPGTDEIRCALLYRPSVVELVGQPVLFSEGPFGYNRPSLIATFRHKASGETLVVSVNHFKSKSCRSSNGDNVDKQDGQACFNNDRTEQAQLLANHLSTYPTKNVLVMGDLNAYAMEDPIRELLSAGFHNTVAELGGGTEKVYSYVFDGRFGTLDYALTSTALRGKVSGAAIWHINSDEAPVFDYNTEYNGRENYEPTVFRSSDHDPVLIGFQF